MRKTSSFIRIAVVTLLTIVLQLIDLTPALPPIAPSDAGTTIQLRAKSTILFTDSPDGTRRSTKRLWVPYGGQVGVYGRNTNRRGATTLDLTVIRDGRDITGQFWRKLDPAGRYPVQDEQVVNKRITNQTGLGHHYWIIATCDIRTVGDCDGTFTISSWY